MRKTIDDADIIKRYAIDVISGKIPNCKWIKLACERHLNGLKLQHNKSYPYYFSAKHAIAHIAFMQSFKHVKGKWARRGEHIMLGPWQKFMVGNIFGWLRKDDDLRKYRRAYLKIARKNGKSLTGALIGLDMLAFDDEIGAEVFAGASDEEQAWKVFGPARIMAERAPEYLEEFGVEVYKRAICIADNDSTFKTMIGQPGDGDNPSCAITDEYHEHETSGQVDAMETGMGSRDQPLMVMITTAGYNIGGPCYDEELYCRQVLDGIIEDDRTFALMYGIDSAYVDANGVQHKGDDWTKPESLIKANPNYGVSVDPEFLLAAQRRATVDPSKQNSFRTKHLNEWVAGKQQWMNLAWWDACTDRDLSIDEFAGEECIVVIDLASKIDICAVTQLFVREINGAKHYYVFPRYYLPEESIDNRRENETLYRTSVASGILTATEGNEIDFDFIGNEVMTMAGAFDVKEVDYDPWRATQLAQRLSAEGAFCVEYRQTVKNMSEPMREVEAAVKGLRLHHDGNKLLKWMVSNVVAKADAKDNIYPRKEKDHLKIDGAVALIMGVGRAMMDNEAHLGIVPV